ncbi:MAG TPA: hypothetical protein DDY26_07670, partial [Moraxellaceae bacterium]|nr:hypothetical protein [Moraxellaceae bacterium]
AEFSDYLTPEQQVTDNLAELGRLTQDPDTNIIKIVGHLLFWGQVVGEFCQYTRGNGNIGFSDFNASRFGKCFNDRK